MAGTEDLQGDRSPSGPCTPIRLAVNADFHDKYTACSRCTMLMLVGEGGCPGSGSGPNKNMVPYAQSSRSIYVT